jgi:hypothetical protein
MSEFTWIPFYKELADKLLAYRDRQGDLVAILRELRDKEIPVIRLTDKDNKGALPASKWVTVPCPGHRSENRSPF